MTDGDVLFDLVHKINILCLAIEDEHITSGEKCPDEMFLVFSKLTKLNLMWYFDYVMVMTGLEDGTSSVFSLSRLQWGLPLSLD